MSLKSLVSMMGLDHTTYICSHESHILPPAHLQVILHIRRKIQLTPHQDFFSLFFPQESVGVCLHSVRSPGGPGT